MKVRDMVVYLTVSVLLLSMLVSVGTTVASAQEGTTTPTPAATPSGDRPPSGDADDDGTINKVDKCPKTPGKHTNEGCPVNSSEGSNSESNPDDLTRSGNDVSSSDITVFDLSSDEKQQVTVRATVGNVQIVGLDWHADYVVVEMRTAPSYNDTAPVTLTPRVACPSGVCEPQQARILVPADGVVRLRLDAPPVGFNNDQRFSIGTPTQFKIFSDPDEPLIGDGKIPVKWAGFGLGAFLFGTVARLGYLVYRKQQIGQPESAIDGVTVSGKYGLAEHEKHTDNEGDAHD